MLEESKDLKPGFRYSQARTLFEDDPRWKVTPQICLIVADLRPQVHLTFIL